MKARLIIGLICAGLPAASVDGASLTPTTASLERQVDAAEAHGYRRAQTTEDVLAEVAARTLDGIGGEPEPLTNGSGGVALAGTPSSETMEESDVRRA